MGACVLKYFGTDGIRGHVGQFPITPEFFLKLGWSAGIVLASRGRGEVIVGKDTRISGYMFESALEAGLSAAGMNVVMTGPIPTPAIAYLTRKMKGKIGVVISASHNPYHDNGIKFFGSDGCKLSNEVEMLIEKQLEVDLNIVDSSQLGKVRRMENALQLYAEFCRNSVSHTTDFSGVKLVCDAGNGATYQVAISVLRDLGMEVIEIGTAPDGFNINKGCGTMDLVKLINQVKQSGAQLGIAFDGDGDRLIMVDDHGQIIGGDELLLIIARYRQQHGFLQGGVVGTLMTNLGIEIAFNDLGIPFLRADVGDRYVNELLVKKQWVLGGESSGHIICRDITTTGDGIIAALQVIQIIVKEGKLLRELCKSIQKFPQQMINVKVCQKCDASIVPEIAEAVRRSELELQGRGRVLIRSSGTEPVVRIMVEGEVEKEIQKHTNILAEVVRKAMTQQ